MVCTSGLTCLTQTQKYTSVLGLVGFLFSSMSFSSELSSSLEPDFEPGFGGFVQLAVLVSETDSLSAVTDENERLTSLTQNAESDSGETVTLLGEISYTLANRQTQLYAGTPQDELVEGNPLFELGVRHQQQDGTLLTVAYLPKLPGFDEVWEDPYLTGAKRKTSDSDTQGMYVSADYLYGGPLSLRYTYAVLNVDVERSGQSLMNQPNGLSAKEANQLRRDADFHQGELSLTLPFSASLYLVPAMIYTRADADGDAFSFDRYGAELFLVHTARSIELTTGVAYEASDYDKQHPVFDKVREDDQTSAVISLAVLTPFNWQSVRFDAVLSYHDRDSNIHFYDQQDVMGMVGVSYAF